jgi:hypothetical protein
MKRARVSFPPRQGGFHVFCHTYGTWMTHFGELDTCGLPHRPVKRPGFADRYNHTMASSASPEGMRADLFPTPPWAENLGKKGKRDAASKKRVT